MDNIFRYIKKEDSYFVNPPYTKYLENQPDKEIKIDESELDKLIYNLLTEKNIKVEEYINNVLSKEGSPGNWKDFSDICLTKKIPPSLCAIKIHKNISDICFIKSDNNFIYTCQIEDDDVFSNLYTFLSEINTYEILYDDPNNLFINNIDILKHLCNKSNTSLEMIKKYLKVDNLIIKEYKRPNICYIDNNLLEDINIFNCYTVQGNRLLYSFIKQPLRNKKEIEERLNIIEELRNINLDLLKEYPDLYKISKKINNMKISVQEILKIYEIIKKIPNLIRKVSVNNIINNNIDKSNIDINNFNINNNIDKSNIDIDINNNIDNRSNIDNSNIDINNRSNIDNNFDIDNNIIINNFYIPLNNIYNNLKNILIDIEDVIDVKLSIRNLIKYNKKCININLLYESLNKNNKECLEEYKRMLNICDKIKYEEESEVFRITRSEYKNKEELLKKNNILIINILKNGINFTTKKLSELNIERNKIKENINKEVNLIINKLKNKLKKYINEIEILNYIVALLDVFKSFSNKSKDPGYTRPVFGNRLEIREGFHPLLEDKDYIGNDILLNYSDDVIECGDDVINNNTTNLNTTNINTTNLIINNKICMVTGPNMGGKSTYLKMIGIVSLLAQVGCYVPAKYAMIPIFDGIYLRMGANDSSVKGCSTFMVEMKDISRICRLSTSKSLILIDELGRGTSEIDGLSIAKAVKDHLYKIGCYGIFATHFPELCDDKGINKKTLNNKLTLLYKIVDGVCDTSYGYNVAELVGFPEDVLEDIRNEMMKNNIHNLLQ